MPVRELRCNTSGCEYEGIVWEWFASRVSKPDPACPKCKGGMERLISRFATPFIGTLDRFKQVGKESFNEYKDGHWAWYTDLKGYPRRQLIRTHAEQKEFCKLHGLIMPDEINPNAEISADGKKLCVSGMKGQWETGLPPEAITETGLPWLQVEE